MDGHGLLFLVGGERLMLHGSDVTRMMTSVQSALARAARTGANGVVYVAAVDENEPVIGRLREDADIKVEFQSGSDRVVIGPVVRGTKRAVRRALRWYLQPMMEQQSSFNHAVLDLVAQLRLDNELLLNELDSLRRALAGARTENDADAAGAAALPPAATNGDAPE